MSGASRLLFASPNVSGNFQNYFENFKEEGSTPKFKIINEN